MFGRIINQEVRSLSAGRSLSICSGWWECWAKVFVLCGRMCLPVSYFLQVCIVLLSESQRAVASADVSRMTLALEDVGHQCESNFALGTKCLDTCSPCTWPCKFKRSTACCGFSNSSVMYEPTFPKWLWLQTFISLLALSFFSPFQFGILKMTCTVPLLQ